MNVRISQSTVKGTAQAPPSKSYTHRAILAAGYASGALVHDPLVSADTKATMRAVTAYGGHTELEDDDSTLDVTGFDGTPDTPGDVIDCANSGTTMRLVTATAVLQEELTVLTGDDSLRSRPQGPLLDAIEVDLSGRAESTRANGQAPLVVGGGVTGGDVSIPGDVSSQYITALLMAGAVTEDGIDVTLETELKSAPYVDITLEVLDAFGIHAEETPEGFTVAGGQQYEPADAVEGTSTSTQTQSEYGEYHIPGDFSSISYLLAAGVLAAEDELTITSAYPSAQGDTAIVDVVNRMGGDVDWNQDDGVITVRRSGLTGVEVSVADTPDLLPTIATLGAAAAGTTRIVDCEHVRYKETDRVSAMAEALTSMGASVEEEQDTLTIHGSASDLSGATVEGRADHRIIMSLAIAGLVADGETTVEGAEHVDVSFPNFFDVLYDLGATVEQ